MKIGIDISAMAKTLAGIGQYCVQMIKELYAMDQENEYYLFAPTEVALPVAENDHWHLINYGGKRGSTLRYMTEVPKILKKEGIRVFVGTRHYLPPFHPEIRYIGVVHDLIPLYMPELFTFFHRLRFRMFTRLCARKADHIVAGSKATAADVVKYMHVPEEKITVLYYGADARFRPERDEAGIHAAMEKYHIKTPYVLCLSTVEPRKNMLRTIQAFEALTKEELQEAQLVIVGGSGWNNGEIYDYVKQHRMEEKVLFTGYASDEEIRHIYANAGVFVYASLCEGFGIPIVEAMQSGTPVITSNLSSMPEVAGDACRLVDPYSVEEIKEAMKEILEDEALQQQMRTRGLKQAAAFSWKRCAAGLHDIILETEGKSHA